MDSARTSDSFSTVTHPLRSTIPGPNYQMLVALFSQGLAPRQHVHPWLWEEEYVRISLTTSSLGRSMADEIRAIQHDFECLRSTTTGSRYQMLITLFLQGPVLRHQVHSWLWEDEYVRISLTTSSLSRDMASEIRAINDDFDYFCWCQHILDREPPWVRQEEIGYIESLAPDSPLTD